MERGTIKYYDHKRRVGFIKPDNANPDGMHESIKFALTSCTRDVLLQPSIPVVFDRRQDITNRAGGWFAPTVRRAE